LNFLNKTADRPFWSDWPFWVGLGFGPLSWCLLILNGTPLRESEVSWRTFLMLTIAFPVLEEYVFRGGLQPALFQRAGFSKSAFGLSLANIVTSLVFAALHLFNQPPLWAMLIFFPSLVFGWMRDRYNNLHACIILHIMYNAGFIYLFTNV